MSSLFGSAAMLARASRVTVTFEPVTAFHSASAKLSNACCQCAEVLLAICQEMVVAPSDAPAVRTIVVLFVSTASTMQRSWRQVPPALSEEMMSRTDRGSLLLLL